VTIFSRILLEVNGGQQGQKVSPNPSNDWKLGGGGCAEVKSGWMVTGSRTSRASSQGVSG